MLNSHVGRKFILNQTWVHNHLCCSLDFLSIGIQTPRLTRVRPELDMGPRAEPEVQQIGHKSQQIRRGAYPLKMQLTIIPLKKSSNYIY